MTRPSLLMSRGLLETFFHSLLPSSKPTQSFRWDNNEYKEFSWVLYIIGWMLLLYLMWKLKSLSIEILRKFKLKNYLLRTCSVVVAFCYKASCGCLYNYFIWSVQKMPFYIFCESYGGKMTAAFAEVLQEVSALRERELQYTDVHAMLTWCFLVVQAINARTISVDFRGVALGDSWISAIGELLLINHSYSTHCPLLCRLRQYVGTLPLCYCKRSV